MKIKPILFSTPMVHAQLDGRKTQTRRAKGLESVNENPDDWEFVSMGGNPENENDPALYAYFKMVGRDTWTYVKVPYAVGDVLWVRETFCVEEGVFVYKSDMPDYPMGSSVWKPFIFMPKAACRLFLKVKGVRVERLQEISEADAVAEGINDIYRHTPYHKAGYENYMYDGKSVHWDIIADSAIHSFQTLWQSINGPESWAANPWVWVVEFEKCDKPENF